MANNFFLLKMNGTFQSEIKVAYKLLDLRLKYILAAQKCLMDSFSWQLLVTPSPSE